MDQKASRDDLKSRVESIPEGLRLTRTLDRRLPTRASARLDVTGVGASEGPARLLASVLSDLGFAARFLGPSAFTERRGDESSTLLLFSQGLCPNARLALRQSKNYGAAWLFTSVGPSSAPDRRALVSEFIDRGGEVALHPPGREPGSLVRFVGPTCAAYAALGFALDLCAATGRPAPPWASAYGDVPEATARHLADGPPELGGDPAALLTTGTLLDALPALAWKWQETLVTNLPACFDLLSFAHGPLQSFYEREATFLLCRRAGAEELEARLARVLVPGRHRIVRLETRLPGPLAWFELDAAIDRLVLLELERRALDPGTWPAQGADGPLYGVGE